MLPGNSICKSRALPLLGERIYASFDLDGPEKGCRSRDQTNRGEHTKKTRKANPIFEKAVRGAMMKATTTITTGARKLPARTLPGTCGATEDSSLSILINK